MASTFFTINVAPAEVRRRPAADRIAFNRFAAEFTLQRKDRELSQGLNARGEPLPGVRPTTREHRKSEMTASGRGDPRAPYLMPGRGLSRTRSLLTAKAHADYVVVWWRFDAFTGDQWGKVLAAHARRGKAYDVIGLSAKGKAWVAAQALKAWRGWLAGKVSLPGVSLETALDPGPVKVELVGRTNLDYATEGIGGTIEDARKAIAEGRSSGFLSESEWRKHFRQARPAIVNAREGTSYSVRSGKSNVLLGHVWDAPKAPPAASMKKAAMGPQTPPKPKKPKPAAALVAAPKAPIADASFLAPTPMERARRAEFPDKAAARAWADSVWGGRGSDHVWPPVKGDGWWDSLTPAEKAAVRDYTTNVYGELNRSIRQDSIDRDVWGNEYLREVRDGVDAAIARRATDRDVVLYRGVGNARRFLDAIGLESPDDVRPGVTFSDAAFTSTTLDPAYAEGVATKHPSPVGPIKFKILIPAGAEGAWIGDNSYMPEEEEFLLSRAMDMFEVIGRDGEWIVLRAFKSKGG